MDKDSFSHDQDLEGILRGLESEQADYPPELLAARRKLFVDLVNRHTQSESAGELTEKDHKLLEIFRKLRAIRPVYPQHLLERRRVWFKEQAAETMQSSVWQAFRSSLRNILVGWVTSHHSGSLKMARASALALGAATFALVAFALYGHTIRTATSLLSPSDIFTPLPPTVTLTSQPATICKDGYEPPLCLAGQFDNSRDLSYAGNGKARPAVAKDTFSGYGPLHHAAHVNDGLYGPGASWVSNSPNSWIKIDLGRTTNINTVTFGRDRLGKLNDGDPGRFVIAVASSDDVYADGDSGNDENEYVKVYDSEQVGFDGTISGAETVVALFELKKARYIKITFENARTAIDEVEAFVSDPSLTLLEPTKVRLRKEAQPNATPTSLPLDTPLPTDTAIVLPTDTLPPTQTVTPIPTDPPTPVETPTPVNTLIPTDPAVPTIPPPIDTPVPLPSFTPISIPTIESIPTAGRIVPPPNDRRDLH